MPNPASVQAQQPAAISTDNRRIAGVLLGLLIAAVIVAMLVGPVLAGQSSCGEPGAHAGAIVRFL